ncbi:MAG: N-acetyltransferase [Rhodothermales bacterium]|nr:N-acetyltransferase [Rhodothermales bacterium]
MTPDRRVIRDAGIHDAVRIAEIYNQSIVRRDATMDTVHLGPSEPAMWMEKQGPREYLGVVQAQDLVLGWGIIKRYHPRPGYARAAETSVYIDRDHTGQGHGSAMQTHLVEVARSLDYHHLVAKIWAGNDGSIRMHQRFGYEMVGVQREIGFVDGQWLDVAILQLILD